jgi:hypothetical protein
MRSFTWTNHSLRRARRTFFQLASVLTVATCLFPAIHAASAQSSATAPHAIGSPALALAPITVAVGGPPVQLNWGPPGPNEFFLISTTIPQADLIWPNVPDGPPTPGTFGLYSTTSNAVEISIPSSTSVEAGTNYSFTLFTCNSSTNLCSNSTVNGQTQTYTDGVATIVVGQRALQFTTAEITVQPGTAIGLHWAGNAPNWMPESGEFFLLSSTSPNALPGFAALVSSGGSVKWPSGMSTTPSYSSGLWATTSTAVQVTIPSAAAPGTIYQVQLYTCNLNSNACSNTCAVSPSMCTTSGTAALTDSQITLKVAATPWTTISCTPSSSASPPSAISCANGSSATSFSLQTYPYQKAITPSGTATTAPGLPLDVAIDSENDIWASAEFSTGFTESLVNLATPLSIPVTDSALPSSATPFINCVFPAYPTFGTPSNGGSPVTSCSGTPTSEAGERIISANGLIWFTQGGWSNPPVQPSGAPSLTNLSRVVAYNPSNGAMCTYDLPDNDAEIIGIAASSGGTIYVAETAGNSGPLISEETPAYLDSFAGACSSSTSYSASAVAAMSSWTHKPLKYAPFELYLDPSGGSLWATDFFNSGIDKINLSTFAETFYQLTVPYFNSSNPAPNNPIQFSLPWELYVDANYVYAADFGDSNLIRLNKSTGTIDYIGIPLLSDGETTYALAYYNGLLYFTLSDNAPYFFYGAPSSTPTPTYPFVVSTIGYVNISAWEAASANCASGQDCVPAPASGQAVLYTGIDTAADPTNGYACFGGIAIGSTGDIALADYVSAQIVRLTP